MGTQKESLLISEQIRDGSTAVAPNSDKALIIKDNVEDQKTG